MFIRYTGEPILHLLLQQFEKQCTELSGKD